MNDLSYIINPLEENLKKMLDNAGIYYRIFARQKGDASISRKLELKASKYRQNGDKMQDIIGIRIVFYFLDDVDIINKHLHNNEYYLSDSDSQKELREYQEKNRDFDNLTDKIFMPTRLNLIFRMNDNNANHLKRNLHEISKPDFDIELIDSTYEIQLRTVLSEGWHEVEHDLRYKTKDEQWWNECSDESRMLNGIYATLETSDRAMNQIFSTIAYKNYRKGDWSAMLKNHLRIHTIDSKLSDNLVSFLNNNKDVPKMLIRSDRELVINTLLNFISPLPLKMDNIVFLINRLCDTGNQSEGLKQMEPVVIKNLFDKQFGKK